LSGICSAARWHTVEFQTAFAGLKVRHDGLPALKIPVCPVWGDAACRLHHTLAKKSIHFFHGYLIFKIYKIDELNLDDTISLVW
jgi:hypothetical protein